MYLIRYRVGSGPLQSGYLEGEDVGSVSGDLFGEFTRGDLVARLADVTLLPPVTPSKVLALAVNFADELRAAGMEAPSLPPLFFKAPSAVIGPGAAIRLPAQSAAVQHGAALAVVIGRGGRWISPEAAARHVLGYTCAGDVRALDIAQLDQGLTRAGSFDTFCPLGPAIATQANPTELIIRSAVNGVTRQMTSTHDLLFTVPQVVAFASAAMTLLPGDVILMGTPAGAGLLAAGDTVEVSIEGVGKLSNPVISEFSFSQGVHHHGPETRPLD
jgi:2-keto-4-pentenoate hydratase/2-oxohepta-3-ene-1,7-dioic acid hydratase in catechol pathway